MVSHRNIAEILFVNIFIVHMLEIHKSCLFDTFYTVILKLHYPSAIFAVLALENDEQFVPDFHSENCEYELTFLLY